MTARPMIAMAFLFGLAGPALAQEFRLESRSFPRPMVGEDGKTDVVIEASGVVPIGEGRLALVAHDKAPALHVLDLATGKFVGAPITSPRFPDQTKTGPKWEGMARDSAGNYYIVGSHSGKTDPEKAEKAHLYRFRLKDGPAVAIDDASVVRWEIARSLESALRAEKLDDAKVARRKIEGLAIRERREGGRVRRELVVGLREPGDKVRAFSADITADPSPDSALDLKPLFAFEAESREGVPSQLTTLEYVPALGGFLVATASEDSDNAFHGNILWFVADGESSRAQKIETFEVAMKCEGLAVLSAEANPHRTAVKLLITFDNDPHATKIPSRFQTATLVRETR